ncbi:MAG TPA: hypothetical protein VN945_04080 [Gemmatimonadales bacterium]|nr:hypothetical protein [Gemmatimonadales bacterium]
MTKDAKRDLTTWGEQPKRRGWDRRADRGRRMVRDRRRETVAVPVERRGSAERRAEAPRRAQGGRRVSDPEGFQRLNL